jgi:hypothetical protein
MPTHLPTETPCVSGAHDCDTETTYCVDDSESGGYRCECMEGFIVLKDSEIKCAATASPTTAPTTEPTMLPSLQPTPYPSYEGQGYGPPTPEPTASPTAAPSASPTHKPTGSLCEDGDHGCDSGSTLCTIIVTGGTVMPMCECLEGYTQNPDDMKSCLETKAPTPAPSVQPTEAVPTSRPTTEGETEPTAPPTHMPTGKQCADGAHPCDTHTAMCVVWQEATETQNEMYECVCLEGFVRDPQDSTRCLVPVGGTVFGRH